MHYQLATTGTFILFFVCAAESARSQAPDTVAALKTYAERAEEAYSRAEYRIERVSYTFEGKVGQTDSITGKQSGTFRMATYSTTTRARAPTAFASGYNSRYSFDLSRRNDAWVTTGLRSAKHPSHGRYDLLQLPFAFTAGRLTYKAALDRSDTKAVRRPSADWRGRPHAEWVLDTVYHAIESGEPIKRRYGLFFPADRLGPVAGVRFYDQKDLSQWLMEEVIEYQPGNEPWPTIKSLETYVTDKTAGYQPWRVSRIDVLDYRRLSSTPPEQEITLSAFGLPEPKKLPPEAEATGSSMSDINMIPYSPITHETTGRWWWWVLLGVCAVAGGAAYVRYRRRNRTT